MRVNIYAEEITDRLELVEAIAENTGAKFYGIRFYLKSSDEMIPPKHSDDDSSAVTFWIKSSKRGFISGNQNSLISLLVEAEKLLREMNP